MWRSCLTGLCGVILSSQLQAATSVLLPGAATVRTIDLTEPFHTKEKWQFVVRQDPTQDNFQGIPGILHFCFVRQDSTPKCSSVPGFNVLATSAIVYPTPASREPVLTLDADWWTGASGGPRLTLVWEYDAQSGQFDQIFDQAARHQTNGEVRIITNGPLAGDIVIDRAGQQAPYRYDITVYRLENSRYTEILNYAGNSKYNDGSGLPVIDAEMAEIERRLHLWKPGDPLPTPVRTHCGTLELRHGVEWCR